MSLFESIFPKNTQKQIAELHIAYEQGKLARSEISKTNDSIEGVETQINDAVITCSESFELLRVNALKPLVAALTDQRDTLIFEAEKAFQSVVGEGTQWNPRATDMAIKYQQIVQDANDDGADIVDCKLDYFFKFFNYDALPALVEFAKGLSVKHSFKLFCGLDGDRFDKLEFLTTTVGMQILFKEIKAEIKAREYATWDRYDVTCKVLGLAHDGKNVTDVIGDDGFEDLENGGFQLYEDDALVVITGHSFYDDEALDMVGRLFAKDTSRSVSGERIQYNATPESKEADYLMITDAKFALKKLSGTM